MSDRYRFGRWRGGPDPLAPPFDAGAAVDRIGRSLMDGASPREALAELRRRGLPGSRGLDDLRRRARTRRRQLRRGQLDGTLQQVRELLDQALEAERGALFPDPSDAARLAEAELDNLPSQTAAAVRQLADYQWRSPEASAAYEQIRDLLRREVLDTQFRGLKNALSSTDPEAMARIKDMLAELNDMLDAEARGEDTQARFEQFMERYGDLFPDNPRNLEELLDSLARRAAAASRMLASLTPEQRAELGDLMSQAMGDMDLAYQMDRLSRSLRSLRPDLQWDENARMSGGQPMGMGDATTALEELSDLEGLEESLSQEYPGASLDDVDREALERALGRGAVDDLEQLKQVERELGEQGYLTTADGEVRLTPKAIRRIGLAALQKIFRSLTVSSGRGEHDLHAAGAMGEVTGTTRPWTFGDEQPIDVVATVRNAIRRQGPASRGPAGPSGLATPRASGAATTARARPGISLTVDDFEVVETERRTSAAVSLLIDLSFSMVLRDLWNPAKTTALALHSLTTTKFPLDALQIVGFSRMARELRPEELPGLTPDMVQGTNLQHALMLAGRHLARHPDAEPVVLVVTDGEPTAHLERDGTPWFDYPPTRETIEATMAEVLRLTRRRATINVFMLDEDPALVRFVQQLARLNGGRVLSPSSDRLGDYVVADYLRARRGR